MEQAAIYPYYHYCILKYSIKAAKYDGENKEKKEELYKEELAVKINLSKKIGINNW